MDTLEFIVGGVFVTLYSIERINTPKINPGITTPRRYWSMVFAYAAASVLLYFALSISISMAGIEALKHFKVIPDSVPTTSPPVLTALLLTVMLSKIPGLSYIDEEVRKQFRSRAVMSRIAGNISHDCRTSPLRLPSDRHAAIVAYLKGHGVGEKDIVFANNDTSQHTWTRIAVLLYELRQWGDRPVYSDFIAAFREEWAALDKDADKQESSAIRCFRLGDVVDKNSELSSDLKSCHQHYASQLKTLLKQLSDFMGRGIVYACGNSLACRRQALAKIGLDLQSDVGYTTHQIAFVIMVTLGGSVLFPLLFQHFSHQVIILNQYIFKVAAGYSIAALVALSRYNRSGDLLLPGTQRPWGRYLKVGAQTVVLTILFGLALDILTQRDPTLVFAKFWHWNYVYQLRPFMFGILIAYLIDTRVTQDMLRSRQWTEAAITAAVMTATSAAIWLILKSILDTHPEYADLYKARVPGFWSLISSSAALGAILGYWLPTSTRCASESAVKRGESRATNDSSTGTATP